MKLASLMVLSVVLSLGVFASAPASTDALPEHVMLDFKHGIVVTLSSTTASNAPLPSEKATDNVPDFISKPYFINPLFLSIENLLQTEIPIEDYECPTVFEPVCTVGNITYPNECFAGEDDARIVYEGVCKGKGKSQR